MEFVPVLVLSYGWADPFHPDRKGEMLRCLFPVFWQMLAKVDLDKRIYPRELGSHPTIGVMIDYACLPQQPRSEEEQATFARGLSSMHLWYSHPATTVLCVDAPITSSASYSNRRAYGERGWCYLEQRMAALVKENELFLSLRGVADTLCAYESWKPEERFKKLGDYDTFKASLAAGRLPPMSPKAVEEEMRRLVESGELSFSYSADLEVPGG
ncbi:MAG: hypothetical protein SGPRY_009129 [Prymnesium sp.]